MKKSHFLILITIAGLLAAPVFAKESFSAKIPHAFTADPHMVPTEGSQEVAFSPKDGATELVVKVINSARHVNQRPIVSRCQRLKVSS